MCKQILHPTLHQPLEVEEVEGAAALVEAAAPYEGATQVPAQQQEVVQKAPSNPET